MANHSAGAPYPANRPDPEVTQLVQRAVQRDPDAFASLYDRYVSTIYRYLLFRVRNISDAEDLTEEVFLRAWRAIDTYQQGERPFPVWLYRIARNLLIDRARVARQAVELPVDLVSPPNFSDPLAIVEQKLTLESFQASLLGLSAEQQQVIVLRLIEGLSYDEVGTVLGKSPGTTRVLLHRALKKLRQVMERMGHHV